VTDAAKRLTLDQERGSGGQGRAPEPRYLAIGQVVGVHGIHGELTVEILTESPDRFGLLRRVFIGPEDEEPVSWRLESYRLHKGRALLKLAGCDDRDTAKTFRWQLVQVPRAEALPLAAGEYYEYQIIGLNTRTVTGEVLGPVVEILDTGANDVYVVMNPDRREILIPAIGDVIREIDLEAGWLVVELPEGLL
jgi:16S rRNA processing protein RimM